MATIREFFQNLLYQVPAIGITDIVDILVVSIIFYSLLRLIRSTSAARVARAILLLLAITLLTDVLNLYTLNWLLNKILEVGAIALIIVFQPELRRALERVGAQLHFHLLATEPTASIEQSAVNATVQACEIMSRERVGVLLVFERETPLDEYFKTGTIVDAQLSEQLLRNLFFKNSPLHDGAVIVRGGRVAAAGCVMPLSDNPHLPGDLGTRHRQRQPRGHAPPRGRRHQRGLRRRGRHRVGGKRHDLRRHRRHAQAPSGPPDAAEAAVQRADRG